MYLPPSVDGWKDVCREKSLAGATVACMAWLRCGVDVRWMVWTFLVGGEDYIHLHMELHMYLYGVCVCKWRSMFWVVLGLGVDVCAHTHTYI